LALLRRLLLRGRTVEAAATWGCGYAHPTARMQYTASSFAQPLVVLFRWVLRLRVRYTKPKAYFPPQPSYETQVEDLAQGGFFEPLFAAVRTFTGWVRALQQGHIQVYLLYILGTLVALLLWQLGQ
jgi:hypothetical protein